MVNKMKALKKKTKKGRSQDYKRNSDEKHEIAYRKSKNKVKTWEFTTPKQEKVYIKALDMPSAVLSYTKKYPKKSYIDINFYK